MQKFAILALIIGLSGVVHSQSNTACLGVPYNNFVRSSESCGHWHLCRNDQVVSGGLCEPQFFFDAIAQTCRYRDLVECGACSLHGVQNIQFHASCAQYIQCINGVGVLMTCTEGLLFNPATAQCEANVVCNLPPPPLTTTTIEPPTTTTTTDSTPITTTTVSSITTTVSSNITTTQEVPTSTVSPIVDCSGTQIYHAHPTDCTRFFICINHQAMEMECRNGLYWNQFENVCDFPEHTICITGAAENKEDDLESTLHNPLLKPLLSYS